MNNYGVVLLSKNMEFRLNIQEEIKRIKKEKDVVILAHYYVDGERTGYR